MVAIVTNYFLLFVIVKYVKAVTFVQSDTGWWPDDGQYNPDGGPFGMNLPTWYRDVDNSNLGGTSTCNAGCLSQSEDWDNNPGTIDVHGWYNHSSGR